jgi:prophage DNA circulation protein
VSFNPALPQPFKEAWREAYRYDTNDLPRLTMYQAPASGRLVAFVLESTRFSGGQSVDTAEYPFNGLWSSTRLNEKPQAITVRGFVRGDSYIAVRNELVEALRVPTSDEEPGYLELPLWGRFPVVVIDFEIEEAGQRNGQCSVSLSFTRAGVTIEERRQAEETADGQTDQAAEDLQAAAVEEFAQTLTEENLDTNTLAAAFGAIKGALLAIVGRVQGARAMLNAMSGAVTGITNLVAQGVRAPFDLANAAAAAAAGIVAGIMEIKNSAMDAAGGLRNIQAALMQFLSNNNYTSQAEALTAKQASTKAASENLYKTLSLCAASRLLVRAEDATYARAQGYWALLEALQDSVDQNSPATHQAVQALRIAASRELSARTLAAEKTRHIALPAPILYLAHYLSCEEELLRRLNAVADSFVMEGSLRYV